MSKEQLPRSWEAEDVPLIIRQGQDIFQEFFMWITCEQENAHVKA